MKDPQVYSINGDFDLRLKSNSPLIDAGYNVGELVMDDFDGATRPFGDGYDIGAYEFIIP